ncbi:putative reverse transcriptase zinc-binding domain-containing protein [Helianthus annuus]|uniref:Reverse transcriptase zinc-binding domain-containing protein n=1 Tax=Helianthus annuus TaxID=4232 RepID=A0A9K3NL80_HELAN|nr:putative reverse transcriptase zinc-binding domain-containing protein [Helianthus annuus]KAJ0574512.1 putative reverse transcriptase zinc-binding domain-containing protein [Helianthus annuus]KAJ0738842.1 putative reverse transcriptase zinc-binding domain-containing protein [Helianthus annuus]
MNKALMAFHIWSIVSKRDSLWVEWVQSYRLKGKSFWVCKTPANCCSSWRNIIHMRPLIRKHVWSELGDGASTSAWFDFWCDLGPLGDFLTPRTITDADFRLDNSVANIYSHGYWNWPMAWRDTYPVLIQLDEVQLNPTKHDKLLWKDDSDLDEFSSSRVWNSVRYKEPDVNWCNIVWFSQCIPRHAFMMWLVVKGKLLTQDKILNWDLSRRKNMNMMCCLLCFENFDSHPHLFFECKYSTQVWFRARQRVAMMPISPKWRDIVDWLLVRARSKSALIYVAKLIVVASTYFIWQERNARLFKNQLRPPEQLSEIIINTVRYKLMGAKLKNTASVRKLLQEWEIHGVVVDDDGG